MHPELRPKLRGPSPALALNETKVNNADKAQVTVTSVRPKRDEFFNFMRDDFRQWGGKVKLEAVGRPILTCLSRMSPANSRTPCSWQAPPVKTAGAGSAVTASK